MKTWIQQIKRRAFFIWKYIVPQKPPWDTGISPPELLEWIEFHPAGAQSRALDIGCGTGTNLLTLAQAGFAVTGVDFAPPAVAAARSRLRDAGIDPAVFVDDAAALKRVSGRFDLILDIGCYHGLPDAARARYRANLPAFLVPGGTFLLYAHLAGEDEGRIGVPREEFARIDALLSPVSYTESLDRWGRSALWASWQLPPAAEPGRLSA